MLKAGIFLDIENLQRNGGWGLRYDVLKEFVTAQGFSILRANIYIAVDYEREKNEFNIRQRNEEYRNVIRRNGFHLVPKEVIRYTDSEGNTVVKANADIELAVDALLQAENLDYILIGSGDGDFVRLVRALQNRGKRVDILSFANTSYRLRQEADQYHSGFLIPNLLPSEKNGNRKRGYLYALNDDNAYGFISIRKGFNQDDETADIFLHINDFTIDGHPVNTDRFAQVKTREEVIEFTLVEKPDSKLKAIDATLYSPKRNS